MVFDLKKFKTLVFDCDGVILDSNKVKTEAFYQACLPYGEEAARAMVSYHKDNGGVSRYRKFTYFLEEIVPKLSNAKQCLNLEDLLSSYAEKTYQGLLTCGIAPGLNELRKEMSHSRWLIVSGGDQKELRQIFNERKLTDFFDGGIFGSPDTKEDILSREWGRSNNQAPGLFIGDSKYDYEAAASAGLSFLFVSDWTEVKDWEMWTKSKKIKTLKSVSELNNLLSYTI